MPNNTYQTVWNPTLNALPQDERGYYKLSVIAAPNRQSVGEPYFRVLNVVANSVSPSTGHPWTTANIAAGTIQISGQEVPTGVKNGSNQNFTLKHGTVDPTTVFVTINDRILIINQDYTISGGTNQNLTLLDIAPKPLDWFFAYYAYGA
jgi:hypothetical protein